MKFAICDDEPIICQQVSNILKEYFRLNKIRCQTIDIYHTGEELLQTKKPYDIIFIDIEMPGLSGIHTGEQYKTRFPRTLFLIITSYDSYIDEAFKFHAFRYISKPINKLRLFNNLKDAICEYNSYNEKIMVETKNCTFSIYTSEIIFIESYGRTCTVCTTTKIYDSVHNISYWQEHLENASFFQTHKSYIVNMRYINSFTVDTILLYNNQYKARLTRRKHSAFKNAYALYLETSI